MTATGVDAAFCVEVNIALVTVTGAVVDAESVVEDPDVTGIWVVGAESLVTATGVDAAFCVEDNIALVTVTGAVVDAESVVEDPDVIGI